MLYFAAFLAIALGVAHSVLGERYILTRLFRRDNLPVLFGSTEFTSRTLRFAWHITTVTWWGIAALLVIIGSDQLTAARAATVIGWTSLLCGLLPLILTRGKHMSWIVFFIIGGIALWWGAG